MIRANPTRPSLAQARALYVRAARNGGSEEDLAKLLDLITRIARRIERTKASNAVSRADLMREMGEMGRVVETVAPQAVATEIRDRWLEIRL